MTRMNVASVRFATARAHNVFPVPGGPYNITPFGGSMPKFTNRSGYNVSKNKGDIVLKEVELQPLLEVFQSVPYNHPHQNM